MTQLFVRCDFRQKNKNKNLLGLIGQNTKIEIYHHYVETCFF
jgi:hypothetical protein